MTIIEPKDTKDTDKIITDYDYVKEMKYYYYFKSGDLRRVNAWKNMGEPIDLISKGGHRVIFPNQKIYPNNFILRHYIALSKEHLLKKYLQRVYSKEEIEKFNWHKSRAGLSYDNIQLPSKKRLKRITDENIWDISFPQHNHIFIKQEIILKRIVKKIFKKASRYFN